MKNFLLIALLCAMTLTISIREANAASWWTAAFPPAPDQKQQLVNHAKNMLPLLGLSPDAGFHEKIDAARLFVQNNSIHKIDKEFYSYWGNIPLLMQMIMFNASGSIQDKPHMECSSRTAVLYYLLRAMDIRARAIVAYDRDKIKRTHTFLEAYNPDTKNWEIQDPDTNFYWSYKGTDQRAGIEDLLSLPIEDNFVTCNNDGPCAYTDKKDYLISYMNMAAIIDFDAGYNPVVLNPKRFDINHEFLKKENPMMYCSLFPEGKCHSEIIQLPREQDQKDGDLSTAR